MKTHKNPSKPHRFNLTCSDYRKDAAHWIVPVKDVLGERFQDLGLVFRFLERICRLVYLWSKLSEIPVKEKVREFDLEKAYDEANPLGYVVFHRIADVVTNLRSEWSCESNFCVLLYHQGRLLALKLSIGKKVSGTWKDEEIIYEWVYISDELFRQHCRLRVPRPLLKLIRS